MQSKNKGAPNKFYPTIFLPYDKFRLKTYN